MYVRLANNFAAGYSLPLMKPRKLYKITISDEARLENIAVKTFSASSLVIAIIVAAVVAAALGFIIVVSTPLKTLIPGYLGDSQRAATEDAIMRIDSIRDAYAINEQYIANIRSLLGSPRASSDTAVASPGAPFTISADSLLPRSPEEARFVAMMQDREKYNITRRASIAAEDMILYPVSPEGIMAQDSRDSFSAHVILPKDASILALADGRVLASYYDVKQKNYVVITQHDRGFVSRVSGLPIPSVGEGDEILGGEAISTTVSSGKKPVEISVELWFDGVPVKPYDYIAGRRYLRSPAPASSSSSNRNISPITI